MASKKFKFSDPAKMPDFIPITKAQAVSRVKADERHPPSMLYRVSLAGVGGASPTAASGASPPRTLDDVPASAGFVRAAARGRGERAGRPGAEGLRVTDLSEHAPQVFAGKFCRVIEGALPPAETDEMILLSERVGYERSLINAGFAQIESDARNNYRCILDCDEAADGILFAKVRPHLPEKQATTAARTLCREGAGRGADFEWRLQRVNPRLRFLRYGPGEKFAARIWEAIQALLEDARFGSVGSSHLRPFQELTKRTRRRAPVKRLST